MSTQSSERTIYTVSELNTIVRALLEDTFPPLWIEGEISNFSCPHSGHWYFSLKDVSAQIRCAMFQGRNRTLNFQPSNGMQVLLRGKLTLYIARGEYQIVADWIEEAGDGALRRAYEMLKAKLAAEGLFDPAHKKTLPVLPKCVGVITSPTGAAIRDILSVLKRRFPYLPIIIYPTAVQGVVAAEQIVKAIQTANQRQECDVLILARGGGSLEDLWSFNEESVARAIYASQIPIVSAVGHEIDFTIADFVSDQRAPTPSAAAELISPDQFEWQQRFEKICHNLTHHIRYILQHKQHFLISLKKRLRHPGQRIQDQMQRLDELEQRLRNAQINLLQRKQATCDTLQRALVAMNPFATLSRGYAIISSSDGEILRDSSKVTPGDNVTARLDRGSLECIVNKILS